ncbi:unnamed protein product [Gordionus sp. m RMFG-2023]
MSATLNESSALGLRVNFKRVSASGDEEEDESLRYISTRYLSFVITMGILSNTLFIVFFSNMRLRGSAEKKSTFYFLVLALFEIAVLLVILPWILYDLLDFEKTRTFASSIWFAHLEWFLEDSLEGFINFHLAFISLDRMIAVRYPFYYKTNFTLKRVKKYVAAILLFNFLLPIPYVTYFRVTRTNVIDKGNNRSNGHNIVTSVGGDTRSYNKSQNVTVGALVKYNIVFLRNLAHFSIYDKILAILMDFLPCIILIVCNAITIRMFLQRSKLRINKINDSILTTTSDIKHTTNTIRRNEISADLPPVLKNNYSRLNLSALFDKFKNTFNKLSTYLHFKSIVTSDQLCNFDHLSSCHSNKAYPTPQHRNIPAERISLPKSRLPEDYSTNNFSSHGNVNNEGISIISNISSPSVINPFRNSVISVMASRTRGLNNSLLVGSSAKLEIIRVRNKDLTILTICLSIMSVVFSLPWIIFLFVKGQSWETEFVKVKPKLQLQIYMFIYTQYLLTPYVIILTSPSYRNRLLRIIVNHWDSCKHFFNR